MSKGKNTRDSIIAQAAELFNLYGYHGTSMAHIMKATGLKKGGIYNHFSGKDEIALASFDYSFGLIFRRFRSYLDGCDTTRDKLFAILSVYESLHTEPIMHGGCPIANTAVDATDTFPALKSKAIASVRSLQDYIEYKINAGKETGEVKESANGHETAKLLMFTMEGALLMARMHAERAPLDTAMNFLKEHLNQTVFTQPISSQLQAPHATKKD